MVAIKVGAGGGAFVTAPTSAQVGTSIIDLLSLSVLTAKEVTEARQVFELGIIPLVCDRATPRTSRSFSASATGAMPHSRRGSTPCRSRRSSTAGSPRRPQQGDVMFANSFRGPTLKSLERVKEDRPEMGLRGNREYRQIVMAMSEGDVEQATAVMQAHIGRTARHVSIGS